MTHLADITYVGYEYTLLLLPYLECPPGAPKLFLAPAKGGGAPLDACEADGTAAPSAASPSVLAGGRRMSAGKGGRREGRLH